MNTLASAIARGRKLARKINKHVVIRKYKEIDSQPIYAVIEEENHYRTILEHEAFDGQVECFIAPSGALVEGMVLPSIRILSG